MTDTSAKKPTISFVIEPWTASEQMTGARSKRWDDFTETAMESARKAVVELGASFSETLERIPGNVDYVDLKFGLKFDAQAGVLLSKVGTQASLEVTLRIKSNDLGD